MATIGYFKKVGDEYQGEIVTLGFQASNVRIVPIAPDASRSNDKAPSHRVFAGRVELGGAWPKLSEEGREYSSLGLDDPSFPAPIYANLIKDAEGEGYSLMWSRPRSKPVN